MFTEAGCTSALLRPALRLAAAWRIAFPEGGASIPFTIENRGDASGAVHARRELRFPGRRRVMVDAVREHRGLVVDALGTSGRLEVALRVDAVDGALVARSSAVRVRVGGLWWRVVVKPAGAGREWWLVSFHRKTEGAIRSAIRSAKNAGRLIE